MARTPLGLSPAFLPEGFPGHVTFVKSAPRLAEAPPEALPEVALCGRSNVGKSTLINTLCNRRQLARVSNTPGRTRLLNFFDVQRAVTLVDLPGFGFARAPLPEVQAWGETIQEYLLRREKLALTLLLTDARRLPEREEQELLLWFRETKRPCLAVLTKVDKVSKSELAMRRKKTAELLFMHPSDVIPFAAPSRDGRDAIWQTILAVCGVDLRPPTPAGAR